MAVFYQCHFVRYHLFAPWFYSWHSGTACFLDGLSCCHHNVAVHTISRERCYSVCRTGIYQNLVVLHIVVAVTIMQIYRSYRACKYRHIKLLSKETDRSINRCIITDGIHIYTDILPCIKVADGSVSASLCSRSRHQIGAGTAITYVARFTIFSDTPTGVLNYFLISHFFISPLF